MPETKLLFHLSLGKRDCLGKSLAKMELFLFLSALLHQFDFHPTSKGKDMYSRLGISANQCGESCGNLECDRQTLIDNCITMKIHNEFFERM